MIVVVDQPSTLTDGSFRNALITDERVTEVLVLKADFDDLPESARLSLGNMIASGKIGFIPLSQIALEDVGTLKLLYEGISIEGLTLLTFCQSRRCSFQSYDPTLLKAAEELNIETFEFFKDKLKKMFNENITMNK